MSATGQRAVRITAWLSPYDTEATMIVWPIGDDSDRHAELRERMGLMVDFGAVTCHLKPTAAEARDIIAALQWALQAREPDALAKTTGEPA